MSSGRVSILNGHAIGFIRCTVLRESNSSAVYYGRERVNSNGCRMSESRTEEKKKKKKKKKKKNN